MYFAIVALACLKEDREACILKEGVVEWRVSANLGVDLVLQIALGTFGLLYNVILPAGCLRVEILRMVGNFILFFSTIGG